MSSNQFIRERSKKIFQTNYVPDMPPREILSAAAGALAALKNPVTGQKIWQIDKPLPLDSRPGALYVYAIARYPVANIGGTVGLTLGTIPQPGGIQFMAVLEDSMAWDIGTSEQIADVALIVLDRGVSSRFPLHGGWAMTGGAWRYGHRFAAPDGIPPDPPAFPPSPQASEQPSDFFVSPKTARVWGGDFPGVEPAKLVGFAYDALRQCDHHWALEAFEEPIDHGMAACLNGHLILPSGEVLYLFASGQYTGHIPVLVVQFADVRFWTAQSMLDAMSRVVGTLNTHLQQQFGAALRLLPPPG